jgi:hypothetical protein
MSIIVKNSIPCNEVGGLCAGYNEGMFTICVYILNDVVTVNQLMLVRDYINKVKPGETCYIELPKNCLIKG